MKKKILAGVAAVIIGFICFGIWFASGTGSTYYYAQIDNSKIEQAEPRGGVINFSGSLDYSYTLFSYSKNGKGKDITFGTSKELKEGAFVRLTVMRVRGVLEWKEVQYEELPTAVQNHYAAPANE